MTSKMMANEYKTLQKQTKPNKPRKEQEHIIQ